MDITERMRIAEAYQRIRESSAVWLDERLPCGIVVKQVSEVSPDREEGGLYSDAASLVDGYADDELGRYGDYDEAEIADALKDLRCVVAFYELPELDYPENTHVTDNFERVLFVFDGKGNEVARDEYGVELGDGRLEQLRDFAWSRVADD